MNWSTATLGELTRVQTGKLDANASSESGAYPFFTCAREPLRIDHWKYDLDAVLIAGNGDLNVKHYKGKFEAYQRTYILDVLKLDVLDSRYLFHFLDKYVEKLREQSIGGIIKYIKLGMLTEAEIPLPPLDEQKRIAAILDQADALRRLRTRALDRLGALGQAIFHEMFGDPVENSKRLSLVRLGDICDVRDGTHDSPKYVEDGYPLLTSKNFSGGNVNFEGAKLISKADFDKVNQRSKVDKGDIVMPMIGTIGSPVIIDFDPNFAIKNVALIKFTKAGVKSEFIHALLSGNYLKRAVDRQGKGGTQKFLSLGDIRGLMVPLPSEELQAHFGTAMRGLARNSGTLRNAQAQAESLFTSLQHRAFRGEL